MAGPSSASSSSHQDEARRQHDSSEMHSAADSPLTFGQIGHSSFPGINTDYILLVLIRGDLINCPTVPIKEILIDGISIK